LMVPVFWANRTHFMCHLLLHRPVHRQSRPFETTDSIPDVPIGQVAQRGVSAAVLACDMKLFLVAYISGFVAKRLLNDSNCDTCKKCLVSEVPSPLDICTLFMEHSSRGLLVLLGLF